MFYLTILLIGHSSVYALRFIFPLLLPIWALFQRPFEQPNVPQSSENGSAIGTLECVNTYDNTLGNIEIKEPSNFASCIMEEKACSDPESSVESVPTKVFVLHIQFQEAATQPMKLQKHVETDGLNNVVRNSEFDDSHAQILSTLIILDTGQVPNETVFVAELNTPAVKPIKFKENRGKSYKQAEIYNKKRKTICGRKIPRREIWPVQKFWVLNTRFKSVGWRHQPFCKGPYLLTKIYSHRKVDIKASPNEFRCTVDNHHIPYLLLASDAAKEWLTLKEQIT